MDIRINKLHLHNFKGALDVEFTFEGRNARLEGPNGSGKSTMFDAFTWLLFGKDHKGNSADAFELKTIDPATGKPTPRIEHWVEAELLVDGAVTTLRREWAENWVKPRGESIEVMRGHDSKFFIDGVNVGTKSAFDAVINGWMNEDAFQMLTNPHYFIDDDYTPWKARRKAIMDLVKDDPELAKVQADFADVIKELSGRSVDDYRKRLAMEKNANKKDLEAMNNKIAGLKDNLPEEVDVASTKKDIEALKAGHDAQVAELKEQIKKIDLAIAGGPEADAKRKAESDAIWKEITRVQLDMNKLISVAKQVAIDKNNKAADALFDAKALLMKAQSNEQEAKQNVENLTEALRVLTERRGQLASDLNGLGKEYEAEKTRVFEYQAETTCPYCGQEIPAATIEEAKEQARQAFVAERKAKMEGIIKKAEDIKAEVAQIDENIASTKDHIQDAEADYTAKCEATKQAGIQVTEAQAIGILSLEDEEKKVRESDEYRAKAKEEQELRVKASRVAMQTEGVDELLQQKATIETEISSLGASLTMKLQPMQEAMARNSVREQQLNAIANMEQQARTFADAIAKGERLDARAAEYTKAQIDSVEKAIAGLFHVARWKMFDQTLDGGIVEMCEVTTLEGVPHKSMNDAMKILCGLDVINVFSKVYDRTAPIFIDNAEGLLQNHFDNTAQIIRLLVKEQPGLTCTTEN